MQTPIIYLIFLGLSAVSRNLPVESAKIDCHPNGKPNAPKCEELGCLWSPKQEKAKGPRLAQEHELEFNREEASNLIPGSLYPEINIDEPWCHYPDEYVGYEIANYLDASRIKLRRTQESSLGQDMKHLTVKIETYGYDGNILRLRIYNSEKERYSPELPILHLHKSQTSQFKYGVDSRNHLIVKRVSNNRTLFDTDLSKLIFTHKFIQLNTELASPFLFGLGEHYDSYVKIANRYRTYSFWNAAKVPAAGGQRSYGSFPFYMNLDENFDDSHGVYLHNSNAMDIIVQADQSITFRPTGGILDFFLLIGPGHLDVIEQFQNLVGRPSLPPIWALGYHLGRRGYKSLDELKELWQRTQNSGVPLETLWLHSDHLQDHKEFTVDQEKFIGLSEFIEQLHKEHRQVALVVNPGIIRESDNLYRAYSLGKEMNVWIRNSTNQDLIGKASSEPDSKAVVFPDFSKAPTHQYWSTLLKEYHEQLKFDGIGLSGNELSNMVDGQLGGCSPDNPIEQTPYKPGGIDLQTGSLCLSAKVGKVLEYDAHNLYSQHEAIATYDALEAVRPDKRPFIVSRSSSPGQGSFGGHWTGNVPSTWDYLRWSVASLIEHSMYGFSLIGSDICGFSGDTTEELCSRWSTLGAFYTFVRNNNDADAKDQDPVAMGSTVLEATKNALTKRYTLVPYLYSLMHRAHRYGEPVVRSVSVQFPIEHETYGCLNSDVFSYEDQFMWGPALMVAPIVRANTQHKDTYLPRGRWYESCISPANDEFARPRSLFSPGQSHRSENVSLSDLKLFYRGGHIIPTYPNAKTTIAELIKQPLGLDVALSDKLDAIGEVYLDKGDGLDRNYNLIRMKFARDKGDTFSLKLRLIRDEAMPVVKFGSVRIMGMLESFNLVTANGTPIKSESVNEVMTFDLGGRVLRKNKNILIKIKRN